MARSMKITKSQLKQIIKEEADSVLDEVYIEQSPDARWWSQAFNMIIEDEIGYGEPTDEQREAILLGLQAVMEQLK